MAGGVAGCVCVGGGRGCRGAGRETVAAALEGLVGLVGGTAAWTRSKDGVAAAAALQERWEVVWLTLQSTNVGGFGYSKTCWHMPQCGCVCRVFKCGAAATAIGLSSHGRDPLVRHFCPSWCSGTPPVSRGCCTGYPTTTSQSGQQQHSCWPCQVAPAAAVTQRQQQRGSCSSC
jgi:hypothetical protein